MVVGCLKAGLHNVRRVVGKPGEHAGATASQQQLPAGELTIPTAHLPSQAFIGGKIDAHGRAVAYLGSQEATETIEFLNNSDNGGVTGQDDECPSRWQCASAIGRGRRCRHEVAAGAGCAV